jgi:glutamate dehydrogenase
MYNISILTSNDLKKNELKKIKKISFLQNILQDENIKTFAELIIKNMPTYFIDLFSDDSLQKFILEAYATLEERALKKHHIKIYNNKAFNTEAYNFSLIILITKDRPFLIDSIREYFFEKNFERFSIFHPIINVIRNEKGVIEHLYQNPNPSSNESMAFIFLENVTSDFLQSISHELDAIYKEVILAVDSFDKIKENIEEYLNTKNFLTSEVKDYLEWLLDENFIFMGIKEIEEQNHKLVINNIGLAELKRIKFDEKRLINLVKENSINKFEDHPIYISKFIAKSKIKRREHFDLIGLIQRDNNISKFYIIIGLYTNKAIKTSPFEIALIREKLLSIVKHYNFVEQSHDHKWLIELLTNFPKIELFNFSRNVIIEILNIIFSMSIKNQICIYWTDLLPQKHLFLFLAAPLEKYSYELIQQLSLDFKNAYKAEIVDKSVREDEHGFFYLFLHFYILDELTIKNIDEVALKEQIYQHFKDWDEELYDLLTKNQRWQRGVKLYSKYVKAFSTNYKSKNSPNVAIEDIKKLENLKDKDYDALLTFDKNELILKVYANRKILLTDLMPVINNAGISVFEEEIFDVKIVDNEKFIHTFFISFAEDKRVFVRTYNNIIEELIILVLENKIASDILNSLALSAKMNARSIDFLRAIRNYIEQINPTISRVSINSVLINNHIITSELFNYIDEKFNPSISERKYEKIEKHLYELVDKIESINDDKIIRYFIEVIKNILRCNFYIRPIKECISFKINSKNITFMIDPKPLYEIYVHSYQFKGIHMRAGKIARGGIRLSDRVDDFRFEILGLMKTQVIKNAIIVPTGAKGGFVLEKSNYNSTEEYRKFISGLLDITDNYVKGKIRHPKNVVFYDGSDPYLVVAADKGTASFSDIANEISEKYNFWLQDAFASGGSKGYDHKALGITAKGAWESVKRHFSEIGKNIEKDLFTTIGIGDMSGDVFGNGMLQSKNMKLIAAFNHKHIFFDPNPDPLASFNERLRLFKLPKSSWEDYNVKFISKGGGIFRRDAKKILLSKEITSLLEINKLEVSGEEFIKLILKMKADLLWNGGIGTYVKDRDESNLEVADHANDNVRINADELNVSIVGEGGNLGFTQKARVSFALRGGKINTDSLDNSAGVDTSDHEVNLKILLNNMESANIITKENKYTIIKDVTEDIVKAVLRDNYEQNLIVSLDSVRAEKDRLAFEKTTNILSENKILSIDLEKILFIKENRTPVRPELCVLLGYSKIFLKQNILKDLEKDDPFLEDIYLSYFPQELTRSFKKNILEHQLAKNIATTALVNKVINQAGISYFFNLPGEKGQNYYYNIYNYYRASKLMSIDSLWNFIDNCKTIAIKNRYNSLIFMTEALKSILLYNIYSKKEVFFDEFNKFKNVLDILIESPNNVEEINKNQESISYLPIELKRDFMYLFKVNEALDIFDIIIKSPIQISSAIQLYDFVETLFQTQKILNHLSYMPVKTHWDFENLMLLNFKFKEFHKELVKKLSRKTKKDPAEIIKKEYPEYEKFIRTLNYLLNSSSQEFSPFNVLIEELNLYFNQ